MENKCKECGGATENNKCVGCEEAEAVCICGENGGKSGKGGK